MKSFFRTLLAVLIGNIILISIPIIVLLVKLGGDVDVQPGSVLVQSIDGSVPLYDPPSGPLPFSEGPETLTSILENLEKARHDEKIEAVVLRLGSPGAGWAALDELRGRIDELRKAGIPICAYTEHLSARSLYLGSACDKLFLLPGGYVSLHGFASARPHIKNTLDKLGIKDNLHKIEKYKSAAEIVQRSDTSPEAKENTAWMLDEFYPEYLKTVEADRGLKPGTFESAVLAKGALVPQEALDLGLVDRLAYFDEVEDYLLGLKGVEKEKGKGGGPDRPRMIAGKEYAQVSRKDAGIDGEKTIAVIHAQGLIAGENSSTSFPLGMTMGAATLEEAFRQAVDNKDVSAIVFRIDSGGGESSASWRISRAAARASKKKPVVVSMSDIAASGGYLIAYPCSTLVADKLSVVGSIGSISGKFNFRGLYDKLGITWDFVTRGPNALIESDYFDYTPEQYESFAKRHWMDYQFWVDDIARYRNLTSAEVDSVGRGRVWTGRQALANGLIDSLGGFDVAVAIAKSKAGIPEAEAVHFIHFPKKEGLLEALKSGNFSSFLYVLVEEIRAPFSHQGSWAVDWNDYR